uniref:Uncharacterized protein n=1 Tax=Tanacetum cinerariifolium TaxID=118510 RepID=A0A699H9J3_TANCI|nr:hypothetical protein [Tanacetum cinerariifolium]GEX69366.1 hypothetical protein [Tanacetum cinerariifolium]
MVEDNVGNQFRPNAVQNVGNQYGNGNVVPATAEGNGNGINDGSAEVRLSENCYDNDVFNMFTQKEQYTELLEPIPEPHHVPQNDSNVIFEVSNVEQGEGTVEQYPANIEETHVLCDSLYNNLAIEVEKVNSVNRKLRETNADLTTELARYKNQEKCFEVSQEKYDKLERMTLDIHNWSSSAHQEIHKIVNDEILPIVNQVDARAQNFKIQFLKEAAKFVRDFKSLKKEADESLVKHKALKLEIERLLRAVVTQDIMSVVQNNSVVDTSNLQTELERTKECFENYIIKKENEYAKLWNNWYKKYEECKYDKISYDKAYTDMQQKIERFQAQLGDIKGKSKDTPCVSNTLDPLPQKLENENVELEFQVSEQKNTTHRTSANTKFSKQSILGKPHSSSRPKLYAVTPLLKLQLFPRIDNFMPNKHVKASVRTKPITVSQPHVITKNNVNSKTKGFSPKDVKSTTKTRRPLPRNNPKNDKVPSKSKSSQLSNNLEKIEENHRNLQFSSNQKHMSYECDNIKLAIRNAKSKIIYAMFVSKSFAVTAADASDKRQQQQDSTSSTSTLATTITADGNFDL